MSIICDAVVLVEKIKFAGFGLNPSAFSNAIFVSRYQIVLIVFIHKKKLFQKKFYS